MSVREYVGARYVPIVVGEWDNTKTYEPLMVVTYQGNSYTSRQYVPTGIEITNESYWVLSANYNAQVDAYRNEVTQFDGRIDANATEISAETTRATEAESKNANAIATETTRATEAESKNANAIATETTRATEAESTNASAVVAEENRAKSAEGVNAAGISALETSTVKIDSRISEEEKCLYVYEIVKPNGITTTSNIIKTDAIGLIDCGSGMVDPVVAQMSALGEGHFDYVIFTHMHPDHVEPDLNEMSKLKTFVNNETKIYVQMEPLSDFAQYSTYVSGLTAVESLGNVIVPNDNATVSFGSTNITMYNTNASNASAYNTHYELNIFSIVAKIEYGMNTYVNCGDIYWDAQNKYTNIGNCDLMMYPHHGVNEWDSYSFINQFSMKAAYASPSADGVIWNDYTGGTNYSNRYFRENPSVRLYCTNLLDNSVFAIKHGEVTPVSNVQPHAVKYGTSQSFVAFLDADANLSYDVDAYKNWSIHELQSKFKKSPFGTNFALSPIEAQFMYQLYAIMCSYQYSMDFSNCVFSVTKKTISNNNCFVYAPRYLNTSFSIFETSPTVEYPRLESSAYVDATYKGSRDDKVVSYLGKIFDISADAKVYAPRMVNSAGTYTDVLYGTYYVGKQTWSDIVTKNNPYKSTNDVEKALKPLTFVLNEAIQPLPAAKYNIFFPVQTTANNSVNVMFSSHSISFMGNTEHFQIFSDNTVIYDTADDPTGIKVSFLSMDGA